MIPRISIIIPTKNEGKYIEKTLKQYLKIKKKYRIEVIVSDGGSTDKTIQIARKYADKVICAKNDEKQSISIGRNAGAKKARGEIFFNTDADVIIPNKEKFFLELLNIFKDKKVVAATSKLRIYPEEEKIIDKIFHFFFNESIRLSLYAGSFLAKGECQIVRASSFRKIGGYNESIIVGEDCNLFYRMNKIGKIKFAKNLTVYHSPRRFRNLGYLKLVIVYAREGVSLLLRGKSFSKIWTPVR